MGAGMFMFAAADTTAKFLTGGLHPVQIVWSRQLGLLACVLVLLLLRGGSIFSTRMPKLQVARGALAAASAALFVFALSYVPLADAVAVTFIVPFVVTVLGALILKEPVGVRRWTAVAIGFVGTLIVIRPGLGVIHPAVILVVVAATCFSLRQIVSRFMAGTDRTITTVAYTAVVSTVLLSIPLPFFWQTPGSMEQIGLLACLSVAAALGEFCVIKALEVGQAVVVAPMQYSLLIWGTLYGFLVFGQLPDLFTWTGAAIIIATGAYTLHRERLAMRRAA